MREQVAKGVAFLDADCPGWWEHINLDTLNMGESDCCIVGQLRSRLRGYVRPIDVELGFAPPWTPACAVNAELRALQWDCLQAEWTHLIQERRETCTKS